MARYNQSGAAVRTAERTRPVTSADDLPVAGASERAILLKDVIYELRADIAYDEILEVNQSNAIVGSGRLMNLSVRTIFADDFGEVTLRSFSLVSSEATGPGLGYPVFDATGMASTDPSNSEAYLGDVQCSDITVSDKAGLGDVTSARSVKVLDSDITGTRGVTTLTNIGNIRFRDSVFSAASHFTDTQYKIMADVQDVIISGDTFISLSGQTVLYLDPLLEGNLRVTPTPDPTVVITGNTLLGAGDFFEIGDEDEITGITDNGDGTVTVATASTGSLANDDTVNILRTENYNGGYVVSNVVANTSFDITVTYVDNPGRGTWHSGSLDQRDWRVESDGNLGIPHSRRIFLGHVESNATATPVALLNTWYPLVMTGFSDHADSTERFALTSDGTAGVFVFKGAGTFKGIIEFRASVVTATAALKDYEFAISKNGATPVATPIATITVGNGLTHISLMSAQELITGDTVQIMVRQTTLVATAITIEYLVFVGQDSD